MPEGSTNEATARDRAQRTALHYAAAEGPVEEVRRLLDAGLGVNDADDAAFTPLHYAAQALRADNAEVLVAAGADLEARNVYGNTPLLVALGNVMDEGGDVVSVLLDAGADPDAENNTGVSPRSLAERVSNFDLMRFFRDRPDEQRN